MQVSSLSQKNIASVDPSKTPPSLLGLTFDSGAGEREATSLNDQPLWWV